MKKIIAGVDEVGRGSLIGPVYAAAVIFKKKIDKSKIKDSKKLTKKNREILEKYIDKGIIEVAPLAYMRGRTLNNSFVILDEAQNTSKQQMLMFLTRLGYESKCIITGDPSQIDLPNKKNSGLIEAYNILDNIDNLGICKLTKKDVVRHPIVEKIIEAYK